MAAPAVERFLAWIIMGEVIDGQGDTGPVHLNIPQITLIFFGQGGAVIFKMVEDIERAMCAIFDQGRAHLGTVE